MAVAELTAAVVSEDAKTLVTIARPSSKPACSSVTSVQRGLIALRARKYPHQHTKLGMHGVIHMHIVAVSLLA